ncbi:MAG: DUF2783 domain-containing protein [Alphaproteobacteria bacterium]|nr:DUF2783 domain-containing protein [Alphaproteobacteria bacterium]
MSQSQARRFPFRPELARDGQHVAVAIVGAGPVGMVLALDLAKRGVASVILDDDDTLSTGSRAVCWARRALDICDRVGIAGRMMEKGVTWYDGAVHFGPEPVFQFRLASPGDAKFPAFINLQQFHVESHLVEACLAEPKIELRWLTRLAGLSQDAKRATLELATPEGRYRLSADWVLACDGARSQARRLLDLEFKGQVFEDRFLIADVKTDIDLPALRRFWFDPPFHTGQTALLHKEADGEWRVDFQLGWNADPEVEKRPENVVPRVKKMLGEDRKVEIAWSSVYTFQCRRLDRFVHGRVIFAGDSAHQVSPFGARGANSGIQDADNLGWKLAAVVTGEAPAALLDSYDRERIHAADENILNSTRSTNFIAPGGAIAKIARTAALRLARALPFARALVNSGRLSVPAVLDGSPLNTDGAGFVPTKGLRPGAPVPNAPLKAGGFLLDRLDLGFTLLAFVERGGTVPAPETGWRVVAVDPKTESAIAQLFDAEPGTVCLIRPDSHVAARWRRYDADAVRQAHARCLGRAAPAAAPVPHAPAEGLIRRESNFDDADGFYDDLIAMTQGLGDEQARLVQAKLLLILANQIGDRAMLAEAMRLARQGEEP